MLNVKYFLPSCGLKNTLPKEVFKNRVHKAIDMGFFTTFRKHRKVKKAKPHIREAKPHVRGYPHISGLLKGSERLGRPERL
jgi:hypothetical protein